MVRPVPCRAVPWCRRKCAVCRLLRREQAPALRVCAKIERTDQSNFEEQIDVYRYVRSCFASLPCVKGGGAARRRRDCTRQKESCYHGQSPTAYGGAPFTQRGLGALPFRYTKNQNLKDKLMFIAPSQARSAPAPPEGEPYLASPFGRGGAVRRRRGYHR